VQNGNGVDVRFDQPADADWERSGELRELSKSTRGVTVSRVRQQESTLLVKTSHESSS